MDAFISYRRGSGALYALETYKFLTEYCYMDVFYDKDNLYNYVGEFSEELQRNIINSENYILFMTDLNIDDYENAVFIKEISLAIKENKRIIVVKANGFDYPSVLDKRIEKLPKMQTIEIKDAEYFKGDFRVDLLAKMGKSQKIEDAYNRLVAVSKLESRRAVESRVSLSERLNENVVSVDLCAMAATGLTSHNREYLEELMKRNCKIRVVMNHPDSEAAKYACEKNIFSGSLRQRMRIIPKAYEDLKDWLEDYPTLFHGRTTDEYLSCAIFITHSKNPSDDLIKVDFYSFDCPDAERRCILIHADDKENFNFYIKQFEWLWEHSTPVNINE